MPALPPVPSVLRVRWVGTDAADLSVGSHLTFHYTGSPPSPSQLAATATTWGNQWATNMAPVTDTGYTLTLLELIDLSSPTSAAVEQPMSHPGTRVGAQLPLNVAMTVQFITGLRRRGGHWHAQVRAGVQTDLADPQHWTVAFQTAFGTAWANWIAGMATNLWSGAQSINNVGVQYFGPPNKIKTSGSGRVTTVSTPLQVPNTFPVTAFGYRLRLGSMRPRLG